MPLAAEVILLLLWLRTVAWSALAILFHLRKAHPGAGAPPAGAAVMIPAYDEEDQIGPTLAAIARLDSPAEVVVVDDGSADRTAECAAEGLASLPSGRLLRLPHNRGKAEALNAGITCTKLPLIATVDADTRLAPAALNQAAARMAVAYADAVALSLRVERPSGLLQRIQTQEYAASLNFERAGQALIGAICVLPGAATVFRRDVLDGQRFSARTATEDADLTLALVRAGCRLEVAADAKAETAAPRTFRTLLRQRTRWTAGHLSCCRHHVGGLATSPRAALVIVNFALTALAPVMALLTMVVVLAAGRTPMLGIGWAEAMLATMLLAYSQRAAALLIAREGRQGVLVFLVEPAVTNAVHLISFAWAVIRLSAAARSR